MRRFISASDVEMLSFIGQKTLYIDEGDVVTSIAKEMATKYGIKIVVGSPPQNGQPEESSKPPATSVKPSTLNFVPDFAPSGPWLPSEFRKQFPAEPAKEKIRDAILLRNGTIVWPGQGIFQGDIQIAKGKIVSILKSSEIQAAEEIDISGKFVFPGIIDPHVHLGIFAPFETDAKNETRAALWGGVTTIGCYLYEKESYLPKLEQFFKKVKTYSYADILFHLTLSTEQHLEDIPRCVNDFGIRSFKIYMCGVEGIIPNIEDSFMRRVYEKLSAVGKKCVVCIHAENASLVRWATEDIASRDGMKTTVKEWSETHPALAEEEAIRRAAFLTREFKEVSTYFVHVSTKGGVEAVSKIKSEADNVYAETTSPYLLFTIERATGNIPKWLPPLRDRDSQEALWENLRRGKLDTLGTDSVPMSRDLKGLGKSVWEAIPNAPSMEHHLPGILTEGFIHRGIALEFLADLMTRRPAEIFGIFPQKGSLMPGCDADLVVVDMDRWLKVDKAQIKSASSFSLFEGKMLTGWTFLLVKGGKIVIKDGQWVMDPPSSQALNEIKNK